MTGPFRMCLSCGVSHILMMSRDGVWLCLNCIESPTRRLPVMAPPYRCDAPWIEGGDCLRCGRERRSPNRIDFGHGQHPDDAARAGW